MQHALFARIRVDLVDSELPIWRSFALPVSCSLRDLHAFIQAAMGWQDYHLWEFHINGLEFGDLDNEPGDATLDADDVTLATLIAQRQLTFRYVYDFGDNWQHDITITPLDQDSRTGADPHFIGGEGRCPPEDVGGVIGFAAFLDAMVKPWHKKHHELLDWYGRPFVPDDINTELIRFRFNHYAERLP